MPLQLTVTDPTDVSHVSAYIWITRTEFNWAANTGEIDVSVHRSKAAAYAGKAPMYTKTYPLTVDGAGGTISFPALLAANQDEYTSLATSLYETILSLPDYQGAILVS